MKKIMIGVGIIAIGSIGLMSLTTITTNSHLDIHPYKTDSLQISPEVSKILNEKCSGCHGEDKQKGDLRVDSMEALLKGGENGPAVVPGNTEKSLIYQSICSPETSEEHMPPKSKPQLTNQEKEIISNWILSLKNT